MLLLGLMLMRVCELILFLGTGLSKSFRRTKIVVMRTSVSVTEFLTPGVSSRVCDSNERLGKGNVRIVIAADFPPLFRVRTVKRPTKLAVCWWH